MKKWVLTALAGIIITPILAFSWSNLAALWAAPEKVAEVAQKVEKQASSLEQISALYLEQKTRQETEVQLNALRDQNLHDQLALLAELKKKR